MIWCESTCIRTEPKLYYYWAACGTAKLQFGLGFSFWHKSHSGVFSACARYKSMRRIGQRTWAEYISNLSSVEAYECKHTNINGVYGKPTVKDGKSTFWKWYSTWTILCERLIYKGTLPSESFIEKPRVLRAVVRGTQREYSSKPLKHRIVKRILVFKG